MYGAFTISLSQSCELPAILQTCLQVCSLDGQEDMYLMAVQEETDSNGGPAGDVEKQSSC